jgi:hypothetical protein
MKFSVESSTSRASDQTAAFQQTLWPLSRRRRGLTPWVLLSPQSTATRCPGQEADEASVLEVRLARLRNRKQAAPVPGGQNRSRPHLSWTGHRIERLPHCRCYNESAYGSRLASVLGLSQPVDSGTAARKVSDQPSGSQEPDQAPQPSSRLRLLEGRSAVRLTPRSFTLVCLQLDLGCRRRHRQQPAAPARVNWDSTGRRCSPSHPRVPAFLVVLRGRLAGADQHGHR